MEKTINTLLRWRLELKRFWNGGWLMLDEWEILRKLRKLSKKQP